MKMLETMIEDSEIRNQKPEPGQKVILIGLPEGFVGDLPEDDQRAITAMIGRPITLNGHEEDGRAELEFTDDQGVIHMIFVDPRFIGSL
jgi:hypothetical protein